MNKKMLRILLAVLCIAGLMISTLSGCAGNEPAETTAGTTKAPADSTGSETEPSDSEDPTEAPSGDPLKIGLVYSGGGRGDRGLNDMMYGAMEKVSQQYGWEYADLENDQASNVEPSNRQFCEQGRDVIINFGFGCIDVVNKLAREYPEIKFITIDAVTDELPNVLNFTFKEYEGSFLVGMVAAMMTETGKVGFVGGMENDLIKTFEAGYYQGAKEADPNVEVLSGYVGATVAAFSDPTKGKEIALSFYDSGADIVYHASGGSGMGVFEAAIQKDKWAIGVDANQQAEAPDNILTSMLKRADTAIEQALTDIANNEFEPGLRQLGLAEDGVGYVNDDTNAGKLPQEVVDKVNEYMEKIKAGEFTVSPTLD